MVISLTSLHRYLFTHIIIHKAAIGRDIYALAGVGDTDNIIRHLLKLPITDIDKIIIKTIEIMENNGLYESISRYNSNYLLLCSTSQSLSYLMFLGILVCLLVKICY